MDHLKVGLQACIPHLSNLRIPALQNLQRIKEQELGPQLNGHKHFKRTTGPHNGQMFLRKVLRLVNPQYVVRKAPKEVRYGTNLDQIILGRKRQVRHQNGQILIVMLWMWI